MSASMRIQYPVCNPYYTEDGRGRRGPVSTASTSKPAVVDAKPGCSALLERLFRSIATTARGLTRHSTWKCSLKLWAPFAAASLEPSAHCRQDKRGRKAENFRHTLPKLKKRMSELKSSLSRSHLVFPVAADEEVAVKFVERGLHIREGRLGIAAQD